MVIFWNQRFWEKLESCAGLVEITKGGLGGPHRWFFQKNSWKDFRYPSPASHHLGNIWSRCNFWHPCSSVLPKHSLVLPSILAGRHETGLRLGHWHFLRLLGWRLAVGEQVRGVRLRDYVVELGTGVDHAFCHFWHCYVSVLTFVTRITGSRAFQCLIVQVHWVVVWCALPIRSIYRYTWYPLIILTSHEINLGLNLRI